MMNEERKEQLLKDAEQYNGSLDCFIHVEKKAHEGCDVCVAGGASGLLFGIGAVINRIAAISGQPFSQILEFLEDVYNEGHFSNFQVYHEGKLEKRDEDVFGDGGNG